MTSSRGRLLRDNAFLVGAVALPLAVVLFFVLFTAVRIDRAYVRPNSRP